MAGHRFGLWIFIGAAVWAHTAIAEGWLHPPIDCRPGVDCWVLQHFDHDPGAGAIDFTCGGQAYDDHRGTDIGLATEADMARGVTVIAAAAGKVKAVRDGEADRLVLRQGTEALAAGRDCGNGVLLDHGQGWQTQYCHMRIGSVAVASGDDVKAGDQLGRVGLSGRTQFPHLHFSVRHNGAPIDPYAPNGFDRGGCGLNGPTLWTDEAARALAYAKVSLVAVGLAPGTPTYAAATAGDHASRTIDRRDAILSAWAIAWHVRAGDKIIFEITGPARAPVLRREVVLERDRLRQFLYVGKRGAAPWPVGAYRARATILRGEREMAQRTTDVRLR